jgi:SPP1 gp7 family putative phage head morphogenesis protein
MFVSVVHKEPLGSLRPLRKGYGMVAGCSCAALIKRQRRKRKLVGARPEYLDWLEARTPGFALKVRRLLRRQAERVAAALRHETSKLAKKLSKEEIEELLERLELTDLDALYGLFTEELQAAFKEAAVEGAKMVGLAAQDDLLSQLDEEALEYARQRAAELVGKKWVDGQLVDNPNAKWAITDTTREELRELIAEGLEDGMSPQQLADEIEEAFAFSAARAETIARTELAFAHVQGNVEGWRQSGEVEGKQSILGSEHDLDDICDNNADAGVIGFDEPFPSGHQFPPYHPNCVCDVIPVLRGQEPEEAK